MNEYVVARDELANNSFCYRKQTFVLISHQDVENKLKFFKHSKKFTPQSFKGKQLFFSFEK